MFFVAFLPYASSAFVPVDTLAVSLVLSGVLFSRRTA
jgi:hypothetical protein